MKLYFLAGIAAVTAGSNANMILNGEFDFVAPAAGTAERKVGGSSGLTGWNILGPAIVHYDHRYQEIGNGVEYFIAHSGIAAIDLTGAFNEGTMCGVSQVLTTVPGQTYFVQFYIGVARSANGSPFYSGDSVLNFSVNGSAFTTFVNDQQTPVNQTIWLPRSLTFTADSTSSEIAFRNGTDSSNCNFVGLDSVYVEVVPEPMTLLALAVGLGALVRRRQS